MAQDRGDDVGAGYRLRPELQKRGIKTRPNRSFTARRFRPMTRPDSGAVAGCKMTPTPPDEYP
jgi:hypothetical protein